MHRYRLWKKLSANFYLSLHNLTGSNWEVTPGTLDIWADDFVQIACLHFTSSDQQVGAESAFCVSDQDPAVWMRFTLPVCFIKIMGTSWVVAFILTGLQVMV